MKKTIKFVKDNYVRILASVALVALCIHWGGFGGLGVIPGCLSVYIWS